MIINIKPLSVNECWQGKRFKTPAYKQYEEMLVGSPKYNYANGLLPRSIFIPEGKLELHFIFGVSNSNSDYDNLMKPLQDCLCKKYNINDNRIYRGSQEKIIVPKGKEYISFDFKPYS